MIGDNRGQVSLEYLIIFAVSLIILIAFTMPLLNESMSNTFDVTNSLDVKSDLSKISQAIMKVYGSGEGSKQTVTVDAKKESRIDVSSSQISSKVKLNDKQSKVIKLNVKSNIKAGSIKLDKGKNTFVVEWPVGKKNMILYKL